MITCGIEIKGSEIILCLLSKEDGFFQLPDCRQVRHALQHPNDAEAVRKFQFTLKKLFEDYKVEQEIIRERPTKCKFAGGAVGFKIEAAVQLIEGLNVELINNATMKEIIKENPIPISFSETGLRAFQEGAFQVAYAALSR
ncbi:MAG: DUF3010 family protein [Pseudomonadota bacterium]|nr:DUF3010 family protein [Pseudomonadota bacterium]